MILSNKELIHRYLSLYSELTGKNDSIQDINEGIQTIIQELFDGKYFNFSKQNLLLKFGNLNKVVDTFSFSESSDELYRFWNFNTINCTKMYLFI